MRIILSLLLILAAGCGDGRPASELDTLPDAGITDGAPALDLSPDSTPDAVSTACAVDRPDGSCPSGRVCRQGACIVDLDPGIAIADPQQSLTLFEKIWTFYDQSYGAFPAKPQLDWDAVKATYKPLVQQATTELALSWTLSRMVGELSDGHTYALSKKRCSATSPYGQAYSNVGACLTEVGGKLLVYRVEPGTGGFQPGDELVRIDGRDTEALLRDLELQPRCYFSYSTPAMKRAQLVHGLLLRAPTDRKITVRRGGQLHTVTVSPGLAWQSLTPCDGRIGPGQATSHPHGILSATLNGGILYIYLPVFGGYDSASNFITQPVVDELRKLFQQATAAKGVLLDLRANPGGSPQVYMSLASWLYPKATTLFFCASKTGPAHDDHGAMQPMTTVPDASLQYSGPLAVLIGPTSFSASDFTSTFLRETGRAKTFGAPSGGGFGGGDHTALDADWTLAFNNILCTDLSGNYLEGTPPSVDFPVQYGAADIKQGKDTVIEAARAWLAQQAAP